MGPANVEGTRGPEHTRSTRSWAVLPVDGFKFLLQHEPDILPDLSQTEIFDKSKASNLAKTVVCCQAIWFCAQCIARWYSDLAFSLLELNTFAHCACALIIFVLWWNKPMDVEGPTLITAETIRELVGLMTICSLPRSSREIQTSHPRLGMPREQRPEGHWTRERTESFQGSGIRRLRVSGPLRTSRPCAATATADS
jgi:hypothetical protein